MKAERLFRVLGLIDPSLIEEALSSPPPVRRRTPAPWRRLLPAAACLVLVCSLGFGWLVTGGFRGFGGGMSGSSGAPSDGASGSSGGTSNGMGIGHQGEQPGETVFMHYGGPVFPLTAAEPSTGLTAERQVTWDFAPGSYADGEPRQWGAEVTDAYYLTNSAGRDITVTALYPFSGSFSELARLRPRVTLDGAEAETALYAGTYSGGFQSTYGASSPDTMNLDTLDSWTEYKALLEDGSYLAQALGDGPVLDIPVTVYEFSDFTAPHEEYQAATQAVSFTIDENATRILTYGFNGCESREDGFRRYSYFVPDGMRRETGTKLLAVLGEDISDYTLQGYENGGCDRGTEIGGVSCTVIRRETTLDALLDRLCAVYRDWYGEGRTADQENAFDTVPFSMYRRAVAELLTHYGPLGSVSMDRYQDGRLDDILSETLSHDRVLYLAFPVTVPAGGGVSVSLRLWKSPSYDFQCSGSENVDLQGYDLVTRLGSNLEFTSQKAVLVNADPAALTLVRQNFGFDLENGIDTITLDPAQEHYYMELRTAAGS